MEEAKETKETKEDEYEYEYEDEDENKDFDKVFFVYLETCNIYEQNEKKEVVETLAKKIFRSVNVIIRNQTKKVRRILFCDEGYEEDFYNAIRFVILLQVVLIHLKLFKEYCGVISDTKIKIFLNNLLPTGVKQLLYSEEIETENDILKYFSDEEFANFESGYITKKIEECNKIALLCGASKEFQKFFETLIVLIGKEAIKNKIITDEKYLSINHIQIKSNYSMDTTIRNWINRINIG